MSCTAWNEKLTEKLYDEIDPDNDEALTAHLATCGACRSTLEQFSRVRALLRQDELELPRVPRVVVLRDRSRLRPALLAASILGAAILAGTGAGAGYALGRGHTSGQPAVGSTPSTAETEQLVQREIDRRLAAIESSRAAASPAKPADAAADRTVEPAVTSAALRAELAKLERKVNGARAADMDYVLDQIAASEVRVGSRIGKTNDALRTVALAANPYAREQ